MHHKTVSPGDLRPGDRVRRLGKVLTVSRVALASEHGAYEVTFAEGATVRLAGRVAVVDAQPVRGYQGAAPSSTW